MKLALTMFRILFPLAIISSNLNGFQTKSMNGDFSKTPSDQLMVKMFPLLDHIAKQSKCNMADDLNKTQMAMLRNNEEKLTAMQNQQADIQKSLESQLETQTNLEKDQRALMETFNIPQSFSERMAKMEEQQTSLQETLKKIPEDLEGRLSRMEDHQKAVGTQLETQVNLAKNQKSQLEALKNTVLENSKKNPEDLEGRLDRMEKNQKDMQTKMETQQAALVGTLSEIYKKVFWPKFREIGSRLFYIDNGKRYTWAEAVRACREMGGYIAAIKDQVELDAIIAKLDGNRYWLGINDRDNHGTFVSAASGKKNPFLKWREYEPNKVDDNEHCVELLNGEMNDEQCSNSWYLICQSDKEV